MTEREEDEQRIEGNIDLTEKEMEEDDQDINHLQIKLKQNNNRKYA